LVVGSNPTEGTILILFFNSTGGLVNKKAELVREISYHISKLLSLLAAEEVEEKVALQNMKKVFIQLLSKWETALIKKTETR